MKIPIQWAFSDRFKNRNSLFSLSFQNQSMILIRLKMFLEFKRIDKEIYFEITNFFEIPH
jgi:hypothetical protein